MNTNTDGGEEHFLHGDALEDSAPVANAPYVKRRVMWRESDEVGFIVAHERPVHRTKWPIQSARKAFSARVLEELRKLDDTLKARNLV